MHAKHADRHRLDELSGNVIGCAFTVRNTLGAGLPAKVCENALAHELRKACPGGGRAGFAVARQRGAMMYDGTVQGTVGRFAQEGSPHRAKRHILLSV